MRPPALLLLLLFLSATRAKCMPAFILAGEISRLDGSTASAAEVVQRDVPGAWFHSGLAWRRLTPHPSAQRALEFGYARVLRDGWWAATIDGNASVGVLTIFAEFAGGMAGWDPDAVNSSRPLWRRLEQAIKQAMAPTPQCARILGMAWIQEPPQPGLAAAWVEQFAHFVKRVRQITSKSDLPIVAAMTGVETISPDGATDVNRYLPNLSNSLPLVTPVSTDDLSVKEVFTARGALGLGARLGAALLRTLSRVTAHAPIIEPGLHAPPLCYRDDGSRCDPSPVQVTAATSGADDRPWWERVDIGLMLTDVRRGGANASSNWPKSIRQVRILAPTLRVTLWIGGQTGISSDLRAALDEHEHADLRRTLPTHLNGMSARPFALLHSPYHYTLHLDSDAWPCGGFMDLARLMLDSADVVWTVAPRYPFGGYHGKGGVFYFVSEAINPVANEFYGFPERNIGTFALFRNSSTVASWLVDVARLYELQKTRFQLYKESDQPAWREGFFLYRHVLTERLLPATISCRHKYGPTIQNRSYTCMCSTGSCVTVHDSSSWKTCARAALGGGGDPPNGGQAFTSSQGTAPLSASPLPPPPLPRASS